MAIDTIDYVTGIGNTRAIRVALKSVKIDKKWPKMTHFSNVLDNISGTQARTNLKIRYPSGDGLLPATATTISFICLNLKRSSPNNETVSKWCRFRYFSTF